MWILVFHRWMFAILQFCAVLYVFSYNPVTLLFSRNICFFTILNVLYVFYVINQKLIYEHFTNIEGGAKELPESVIIFSAYFVCSVLLLLCNYNNCLAGTLFPQTTNSLLIKHPLPYPHVYIVTWCCIAAFKLFIKGNKCAYLLLWIL